MCPLAHFIPLAASSEIPYEEFREIFADVIHNVKDTKTIERVKEFGE